MGDLKEYHNIPHPSIDQKKACSGSCSPFSIDKQGIGQKFFHTREIKLMFFTLTRGNKESVSEIYHS
jgi:hypothetical protein